MCVPVSPQDLTRTGVPDAVGFFCCPMYTFAEGRLAACFVRPSERFADAHCVFVAMLATLFFVLLGCGGPSARTQSLSCRTSLDARYSYHVLKSRAQAGLLQKSPSHAITFSCVKLDF